MHYATIREAIAASGLQFTFRVTGCGRTEEFDLEPYDDENRGLVYQQLAQGAPREIFVFEATLGQVVAVPRPRQELMELTVEQLKRSRYDFHATAQLVQNLMLLFLRSSEMLDSAEYYMLLFAIANTAAKEKVSTVEGLNAIIQKQTEEIVTAAQQAYKKARTVRNVLLGQD